MISNEILKALDHNHITLLNDIFNACLMYGTYPWNASIITPLHKKGNKSDPDNYRAVAVSSVIGKLFSTILLQRLIKFRTDNCPDPPNQLGFTKKAQTYDHILTMRTIASKYKSFHKPVYAVFVDFKKAFDSVCRQALFLKLAKSGITGNFYNVLRNMYSNSFAYIKMSGHISNKFQIRKGTEQGHPLSPDLFKVFLSDLSPLLELVNCPTLDNVKISHLLWADDLILISLDQKTCQLQLNILSKFCKTWGIEINEIKTQVVIFNRKFHNDAVSPNLLLDEKALKIVESYCYLGITLHQSGAVKLTQQNLKTKAMRAFFGLKRVLLRSKLSFKALSTLFDSLIKPIILYGAPIWSPHSTINKLMSKSVQANDSAHQKTLRNIANSVQEKTHLSFLKWALGVHRKSSNIGVWGETGRFPLFLEAIRLSLNYFKRLESLDPKSLVQAALREQKSLNLPWFKGIKPLLKLDDIYSLDHVTAFRATKTKVNMDPKNFTLAKNHLHHQFPILTKIDALKPLESKKYRVGVVLDKLKNHFTHCWETVKSTSPKLKFYHSTKNTFSKEPYLDICKGFSRRYSTTKIRISAHDLKIEQGRYMNIPRDQRICPWCKNSMGLETLEDEDHMLYVCDLYSKPRSKLIANLNNIPLTPNNPVEHPQSHTFNINTSNLREHLTAILSPNIPIHDMNTEQKERLKNLHNYRSLKITANSSAHECFKKRRSYAVNNICTYLYKCFEERNKLFETARITKADSHRRNNFTINFVRNQ